MQDFCTTISDIDLLAARCADSGYWRKVLTKKSYGVPFDGLYFFGGWTRLAKVFRRLIGRQSWQLLFHGVQPPSSRRIVAWPLATFPKRPPGASARAWLPHGVRPRQKTRQRPALVVLRGIHEHGCSTIPLSSTQCPAVRGAERYAAWRRRRQTSATTNFAVTACGSCGSTPGWAIACITRKRVKRWCWCCCSAAATSAAKVLTSRGRQSTGRPGGAERHHALPHPLAAGQP